MPGFEAKVRVGYKDVEGLVLDCPSSALALDGSVWTNQAQPPRAVATGSHTGSSGASTLEDTTKHWREGVLVGRVVWNLTDGSMGTITANTDNEVTAVLAGGTDDDWDGGDQYIITTYRMGDLYQVNAAKRPDVVDVGGFLQANFDKANSDNLRIPIDRDMVSARWSLAFEYYQQGADDASQFVLGFDDFKIFRTDASKDYGYEYNSTQQPDSGDMTDGMWAFLPAREPIGTAQMYQNGVSVHSGSFANFDVPGQNPSGYIGSRNGFSDYCSMGLRGFYIWDRPLSPLELDFIMADIHTETQYNQENRCTMGRRVLTDITEGDDDDRLNPIPRVNQRFVLATLSGTDPRIQISCSKDGVVSPDAPSGDNFVIDTIEYPGINPPLVVQQTNWSAIMDVKLVDPGHYTFLILQPNAGQVILHVDAE